MKLSSRRILKILFLLFLIFGTIYILARQQSMPYQNDSGQVFGTMYNITYQNDKPLGNDIRKVLNDVDFSLSMFNPHSIVSRVNDNKEVTVNDMFSQVFNLAHQVAEITDGAFDPTVAPLVNLWGFGTTDRGEPDQGQIDSIRQFTGYSKIKLVHGKLSKIDPRVMLDCGAIAKGYACDVVAKLLKQHDIKNYMIEIGGEVVTCGNNKEGKKWRIGITRPEENETDGLQEILEVNDCAIATSGNYRNYYVKDGQKYSHTINPLTGQMVHHNLLSATVIAPSCAMADAYATAFMVLGLDGAKAILEKQNHLSAYLVYSDGVGSLQVWCSPKVNRLKAK